jgi:hypothetical protein
MMQRTWVFASLAAACALALGACSKQADTNPNAPGNPGTGNATLSSKPVAPDGPPGGPSGVAGSSPHTGSSGGDVLPGTSGSGTAEASGRSQTPQPGSGLNGGLNAGTAAIAGASAAGGTSSAPGGVNTSAAGNGSSNATPDAAVGRR